MVLFSFNILVETFVSKQIKQAPAVFAIQAWQHCEPASETVSVNKSEIVLISLSQTERKQKVNKQYK